MVLILHAFGLNSDQYVQFAKYLTNENFVVAAFDLPGHGRSGCIGGIRGYLNSFEDYVLALDKVVGEITNTGGSMREAASQSFSPPLPTVFSGTEAGRLLKDNFKGS